MFKLSSNRWLSKAPDLMPVVFRNPWSLFLPFWEVC